MAVAHRASAAASTANPTTTFACTIPASVVADDVLFLLCSSKGSTGLGSLTCSDNDTGGNTWALAGNSTNHILTLWWKRATSGTASKVVTIAGAVGSSAGGVSAFSGALASGNPYTDVSAVLFNNDYQHTGFTPTNADSFVCLGLVGDNDTALGGQTAATLGALTEFWEKLSNGGTDCGTALAGKVSAGGPTATGTFTWTDNGDVHYSIAFAIKIAAAGGSALPRFMHNYRRMRVA